MNENEFRDLMGSEIGEEPPVAGGPAAVFAGARRQALRTRALTGTLSVAAVLGVAAGAVAISGGSGASGGATRQAVSGTPAVTSTAGTGGTAGTTGAASSASGTTLGSGPTSAATSTSEAAPLKFLPAPKPGPGQVLMDGRSAVEILKELLPAGTKTADYNIQDSYKPEELGVDAYGAMSVTDATGHLTTASASVQESTTYGDTSCAKLQLDTVITDCHETPQADGSRVLVFRQNGFAEAKGKDAPGGYANMAWRVYPNGTRIMIMSANYLSLPSGTKNFAPTASVPLLTPEQVQAIALDHRWQLTIPAEFALQARRDVTPIAKDFTQKG